MPITVLPKSVLDTYSLGYSGISLMLYNEDGDFSRDLKIIKKNGKKLAPGFTIEYYGKPQTEDMMESLLQSQDPIFVLAILGYIVTLIYSVNIVVFWVEKRKYEIAVRKAFGYTDKDIAKIISGEILALTGVAAIIALLIQAVVGRLLHQISKYTLEMHMANIMIAVVVVLITAFLTSIWPVRKAMRIPPIETLKEGESI